MTDDKKKSNDSELKRHMDEELDEALEETFPASDPIEPPLESEHQKPKPTDPHRQPESRK